MTTNRATHSSNRQGLGLLERLKSLGGLIGVALFVVAWELFARHLDKQIFLVPPSAVAEDLYTWFSTGDVWPHLSASAKELGLGFAIGLVGGLLIGSVMGLSLFVRNLFEPLVVGLNSIPALALTPLYLIWFGFGLTAKILVVASVTIFPIIVNTQSGIAHADAVHLDVVRSFGASRLRLVTMVRFPAAIPFIIAGTRVAIARAVTGVFVAELFGATVGIGYTINASAGTFQTDRLLSGVVILAAAGIGLSAAVTKIGKLLTPYRRHDEKTS